MIRKPMLITTLASRMPVTSAATVDAAMVTRVPSPTAAPPAAAAAATATRAWSAMIPASRRLS
jgi:hypothetical protein